jgi:hypothetical protein
VLLGLVTIFPGALALASALLLLARIKSGYRESGSFAQTSALDVHGLALALGLVTLHTNPFANTRYIAVAGIGSLLLLLFHPISPKAGRLLLAVVLFGMLVAYPLANVFRGDQDARYASGLSAFGSADFDGFQQEINSFQFERDNGHTWGLYTVSALGFFVPRSVWHAKARPASIDVSAHRGYVFQNLSLPFQGELFLEFGWPGLILITGGIALLIRRVDDAWVRAPSSRVGQLAPYVAVSALSVIRGPLGSNGPVYLSTLGLLYLGLNGRWLPAEGGDVPPRTRTV